MHFTNPHAVKTKTTITSKKTTDQDTNNNINEKDNERP